MTESREKIMSREKRQGNKPRHRDEGFTEGNRGWAFTRRHDDGASSIWLAEYRSHLRYTPTVCHRHRKPTYLQRDENKKKRKRDETKEKKRERERENYEGHIIHETSTTPVCLDLHHSKKMIFQQQQQFSKCKKSSEVGKWSVNIAEKCLNLLAKILTIFKFRAFTSVTPCIKAAPV